jgi:DNA-binding CsgD family transcriptional regulator
MERSMKKRRKNYWDIVLEEVLNQGDQNQTFRFTQKGQLGVREQSARYRRTHGRKEKGSGKCYSLGEDYPGATLTPREAQCMVHLLQGKTQAKVAEAMGLSRRTIEFYVRNMKLKLGCETQPELIEFVYGSEFLKGVDF